MVSSFRRRKTSVVGRRTPYRQGENPHAPPETTHAVIKEKMDQQSDHILAVGILMDTFERVLMEIGVSKDHIRKVQKELTHTKLKDKQKEKAEKDHERCVQSLIDEFFKV
jgi:hypothetical protein